MKSVRAAVVASLLCAAAPALAKQTNYDIQKGGQEWRFDASWTDAAGEKHQARFSLPTAQVKQDLETPLSFKKGEASKAQAQAINDYAKTLKGVDLDAVASGGKVSWSASGKRR